MSLNVSVSEHVSCERLCVSDQFQTLRTAVLQPSGGLQQGVGLFVPQDFQVSPSYLDLVQNKFGARTQNVAFTAPQDATNTINLWAQDATGDQVRELVPGLDAKTELLLATAAAYQGLFK